jgi:hypothetical protein
MNSKGIIAIVVGVVLLVLVRWGVGRLEENQRVEARRRSKRCWRRTRSRRRGTRAGRFL